MARIARWVPVLGIFALLLMPGSASAQDFYMPDQLTEQPGIKSASQAQKAILRSYPRALRDASIGGKVQLRFIVGEDGKVDPASVEVMAASVKALGEAASKAVQRIKFVPGKKDGSSVRSMVVMPIVYGVS
jgi:TonB family protein